ncbi:hypothetical protein NMG60_11001944 [Bertholletia excelsa]
MEPTNGWLCLPLAIRRFCPARLEQEQGGEFTSWEKTLINNMDLVWSPSDNVINNSSFPTSEEEEFVDSFFNMDDCLYGDVHENNLSEAFDNFQEGVDSIPMNMMLDQGENEPPEPEMTTTSFEDSDLMMPVNTRGIGDGTHGVDQGLHLVHSLLACAEAVGCRDTQLADSLLAQIWPWVSPWGDSLQRVAHCFAVGLKSRLSLLQNVNANGTLSTNGGAQRVSSAAREEKLEAFHLLHQTTPYIAVGFMAANDAISQAAQGKPTVHIIDLGMEHTLQWPSLIRTLVSRPEGPPKLLRITGILGDYQEDLSELQASINGLADEAGALGIPLEFDIITEPLTPSLLSKEKLKLREGDAVFVNSIMHLHRYVKESRGSLKTILQAIKKLGPTLLTVVEQDANHNGPFFLGRFLESLHYYSAMFDSLEASLPRNSPERMKIERIHLAEEIRNIVACEGSERTERHERADQWRRQLGRAGFQVAGLKTMSQARMMLSVYGCDGYTLASDKGCLLLGWEGRPIMLASAWQVPNATSI